MTRATARTTCDHLDPISDAHLDIGDHLSDVQLSHRIELESVDEPDARRLDDLDHVEVCHDEAPVARALGVARILTSREGGGEGKREPVMVLAPHGDTRRLQTCSREFRILVVQTM